MSKNGMSILYNIVNLCCRSLYLQHVKCPHLKLGPSLAMLVNLNPCRYSRKEHLSFLAFLIEESWRLKDRDSQMHHWPKSAIFTRYTSIYSISISTKQMNSKHLPKISLTPLIITFVWNIQMKHFLVHWNPLLVTNNKKYENLTTLIIIIAMICTKKWRFQEVPTNLILPWLLNASIL